MQSQKESRLFLQKLLQCPPELPFDPKLLPMLFAVTQEGSHASLRSVTALIEQSPKLVTRVLTVANSAAFGLEFKVSSLQRAINIIGLREVRLLVLMVGMSSFIREAKLPKTFDAAAFWQHLLQVAGIARIFAEHLGGEDGICGPEAAEGDRLIITPDEAYIAGLLHDVGKVFLAAGRPDIWEEVTAATPGESLECFEAENAFWHMDHALIGAAVLHHWKLPLILTEAINLHHAPELASTFQMEARLIAAADCAARMPNGAAAGPLNGKSLSFLPQGCDAASLGAAVATGLAQAADAGFASLEA